MKKNSIRAKEWHKSSNRKGPRIHGEKIKILKVSKAREKNFTYKKIIILTDFSRALDTRIQFLWQSNFESRIARSACGTNMGHKRQRDTKKISDIRRLVIQLLCNFP